MDPTANSRNARTPKQIRRGMYPSDSGQYRHIRGANARLTVMLTMEIRSPWPSRGMWIYDRAYLRWHGLDRPEAELDPVLRIEVRTNRAPVTLPCGTIIRRGERVGLLHFNNDRIW